MPTEDAEWISALRSCQDRLATLVETLDTTSLQMNSYCTGWDIAQVLSHIGGQAEMFGQILDAGLTGEAAPGQDGWPPIWDAWNARTPEAKATDSVAANERLVSQFESLDQDQVRSFHVAVFGMQLDLVGVLRLRLPEQAIHSWDIEVSFDPTSVVSPDSVALLVDNLANVVAYAGKPTGRATTLHISTSEPEREFVLVTDGVRLEPWSEQSSTGTLELPAEALVRLIYGRLDLSAAPSVVLVSSELALDDLRTMFPGV
ncbi:MAG: maleylpyruvate isomerase family mycothiol-dependent enzyme [Candidatus Dormiibacterota bacterium]